MLQEDFYKIEERELEANLITEVRNVDFVNSCIDQYGVLYSKDKKKLIRGDKNLVFYTINNECVTICDNAFNSCKSLKKINIPNSVIKIGKYAFSDCSALTEFFLPISIEYIDDYAFNGCTSLVKISFSEPIDIGKRIFNNCCNLQSIYYPSWSGEMDLKEYKDLLDRTKDYPFINNWSLKEFIDMYGHIQIKKGINDLDGDYYTQLVFYNAMRYTYADDKYYNGKEIENTNDVINNSHLLIGQDDKGNFFFYDKTYDFYLPGMEIPY